jgi:hypothetical protein
LRTSAIHACATSVAIPGSAPKGLSGGTSAVICGEMTSKRPVSMSTGAPSSTVTRMSVTNPRSKATAQARCAASSAPKNGSGSASLHAAPNPKMTRCVRRVTVQVFV